MRLSFVSGLVVAALAAVLISPAPGHAACDTTTTTTTLPYCDSPGQPCGSCGNGTCIGACPEGHGGLCTINYSSIGCVSDQQCPPGEVCFSVRLGTDYCGGACFSLCP